MKLKEQITEEFYDLFFNTVRLVITQQIDDDVFEEIYIDYELIKKNLLEKMKKYGFIKGS